MNLVGRAKNIILTSQTEWQVNAGEEPNTERITCLLSQRQAGPEGVNNACRGAS